MNKIYAGIGSRAIDDDGKRIVANIAASLSDSGWTLRSGGAKGTDTVFECNSAQAEIYRPTLDAKDSGVDSITVFKGVTPRALRIAKQYHPAWDRCSPYVRRLHARNVHILLGMKCDDPVHMVVCWTTDGKDSGGTGQGIRIARGYDIPVFNLRDMERLKDFLNYMTNLEENQ